MADQPISIALAGCTGLVGKNILQFLLSTQRSPPLTLHTLTRRSLPPHTPTTNQKTVTTNLIPHVIPESNTWPSTFPTLQPSPQIFISALGTSKAAAGSFAAQYEIDYTLNLNLAKAAKEAGVKVYVLISASAISRTSAFAYNRMKAELEDAVREVGFEYTVLVKPGLLVGKREDSRPAEAVARGVANGLGRISKGWLTDWWAQDVETVGRAAGRAGLECLEGKREKGVSSLPMADVVRLGRPEGGD